MNDTRLHGEITRIDDLTSNERERMLRLLRRHYENVCRAAFLSDLSEKQLLLKVTDDDGTIQGFSTQVLQELPAIERGNVAIVFSGDTILDEAYWGHPVMPKLCAHFGLWLTATYPEKELYWYLICKGHKTYRFLPTMFRDYYPHHARPTPPESRAIIDAASRMRYSELWRPAEGIIVACERDSFLQSRIAEPTDAQLRRRATRFFYESNPGYARGDSLCCIASVREDNFTKVARGLRKSPLKSPPPSERLPFK